MITVPVSKLMMKYGRQKSFMIGGVLGEILCVYSVYIGNFWHLFFTFFVGMFNRFGEFIKYGAADFLGSNQQLLIYHFMFDPA